ncbi:MAG: NusG domain II-containing protein [Oscillospiraceae bacterium]
METKKKLKSWNWLVIFALFAAVCGAAQLALSRGGEKTAYVYSGGELVRTVALHKSDDYTFTVDTAFGWNVIHVHDGSICVEEASCKNQICVHTGAISDGAGTIICAPNKLVIVVKSAEGNDYDI